MEKEIVFLEPNHLNAVPFTTSDIIAEMTGIHHRRIREAIRKYKTQLEKFGKVVSYATTLESGQMAIGYHLTEEQATFLITLLKNTPSVVAFKQELVRQFYAMRTELQKRQIQREALKPVRRSLTDAIQTASDNPWAYKLFTDLAYKSVIGRNATQLRRERGADKNAIAVDYMTAEEIQQITKRQEQFAVLIEMGMDYQQIKALAGATK